MLNLNNVGRKLAKIVGGKFDGKYVSVFTEGSADGIKHPFNNFVLDEGKFEAVPDDKTERVIAYVSGPSGSGKSYWCSQFIKKYLKQHPQSDIILFSAVNEDEALDKFKNLKRVRIDENLVDDPIQPEDLADSLVIMDDIDSIGNKRIREAVYSILNRIAQEGRHHRTSLLVTNHLPTGGRDTRMILNESHIVVVFLASGSARGNKYLLQNYVGLSKYDIEKCKMEKSRATVIFKNYPQVCMSDKRIWVLSED